MSPCVRLIGSHSSSRDEPFARLCDDALLAGSQGVAFVAREGGRKIVPLGPIRSWPGALTLHARPGTKTMPRYFFHIDEARCHIDTEGLDLPDLEAAKREALKIIGELMIDNAVGGVWSTGGWSMTVAGECAQELFVIRLSTSWRNEPGAG